MDAVDDGAFGVGLEVGEGGAEGFGKGAGGGDDVGEGVGAVDGGFARAEEVEVGAVDEEDGEGHLGVVLEVGRLFRAEGDVN